jgi:hypothetical protein
MLVIARFYRSHQIKRFHLCLALSYVPDMALVTPAPRSSADATRRGDTVRLAEVVPLKQDPGTHAAHVGERTRRERVRMELLVDRARAARQR